MSDVFSVLSFSCDFIGTQEDFEDHLKGCKFDGMKDFLQRTEEKMADLQFSLNQKDQEIGFLRSMLGKLSERLENLEKSVEIKIGDLSFLPTVVEINFISDILLATSSISFD